MHRLPVSEPLLPRRRAATHLARLDCQALPARWMLRATQVLWLKAGEVKRARSWGLTLELSRPLRRDAGPARPMIDMQGLAGPVARRSGSALEREVRRRWWARVRRAGCPLRSDGVGGGGDAARISPPDSSRTGRRTMGPASRYRRRTSSGAEARCAATTTTTCANEALALEAGLPDAHHKGCLAEA